MAKKLFKNYNFSFDKNEAKLINTFCGQAIKQMMTDDRFAADIRAFESIREKISADPTEVKLTKDEKTRLTRQLKENTDFLKQKMDKAWFIKKWIYRSMYNQYKSLLSAHFED